MKYHSMGTGFRKMKGRQKIKKYTILSLLLVTFILSIDFADAKNGKWKPGNENYRRFPMDRTLQNDGRIPTGKTIQNDRRLQNDGNMQSDKIIFNDRLLQNDKRIPIGKVIQNDRRLLIDGNMQNYRRIPIDRTLQNDRRIPIDRTLRNDRRILTGQRDRMQNDRKIKNDSEKLEMQYNKRVHSASVADGIMGEDGRKRINRILKNDRFTTNELQKKIDSLTQNKNIQKDNRIRDSRRMLNIRMQNDRQTQNDLEVQNARRILDERNQEMINARRTGYEKRMWAVTSPHITARQRDWAASPQHIARQQDGYTSPQHSATQINRRIDWSVVNKNTKRREKIQFNPAELIVPKYNNPKLLGNEKDAFIKDLVRWNWNKNMKKVHYDMPFKHSWMIYRVCHIVITTFISSQVDIRKYYTVRYFYQGNIEYEVGYLVNDIVLKYQRMLEIYDLATQYYYKNRARFYAPTPYVLYLYTSVLEMAKAITHLCNMLTEIEDKYTFIPVNQTAFSDYHLSFKDPAAIEAAHKKLQKKLAAQVRQYEMALAKFKAQKLKNIKKSQKERVKTMKFDETPAPPNRFKQKKSNFPRIYGWSVEFSW